MRNLLWNSEVRSLYWCWQAGLGSEQPALSDRILSGGTRVDQTRELSLGKNKSGIGGEWNMLGVDFVPVVLC